MRHSRLPMCGHLYVTAVLALLAFLCAGSIPRAAADELPAELTQFGESGSGSGQISVVQAIAANPTTGNIYLGESGGSRVSEFTAWGEFVRTWGWGVLDGSPEFQICSAGEECQAAIAGSGAGQFQWANGLSVAPDGSVYVFDRP